MTLLDIITTSLLMLERGTDSHTIENYRTQFTRYANDAVNEVLRRIKQQRCDVVDVIDNTFFLHKKDSEDTTRVPEREVVRINKVTVTDEHGHEIPVLYKQKPGGSGEFKIMKPCHMPEVTECNVYYRFVPMEMVATKDVPEIPPHTHYCLPYYVVAMARMNSDASNQGTASIYLQMFNQRVMEYERESRGEPESFRLLNY